MDFCKFCKKELSPQDKDGIHGSCMDWVEKIKSGQLAEIFQEIQKRRLIIEVESIEEKELE